MTGFSKDSMKKKLRNSEESMTGFSKDSMGCWEDSSKDSMGCWEDSGKDSMGWESMGDLKRIHSFLFLDSEFFYFLDSDNFYLFLF
jgi:hypothetical protein